LQPSLEIIEFDVDLEFKKLFEKLGIFEHAQNKSYYKRNKTEDQSKNQLHPLFPVEELKQDNQKFNTCSNTSISSTPYDSVDKKESSPEFKFNDEDLSRLKLNLIKEQSEVIALKKNLEEKEEAYNIWRTKLYNHEMCLVAKQRDLDNTLEDLFKSTSIDLKKKIVFMSGLIDWRIKDAISLLKSNDKRFLFNCKNYLDCIYHKDNREDKVGSKGI